MQNSNFHKQNTWNISIPNSWLIMIAQTPFNKVLKFKTCCYIDFSSIQKCIFPCKQQTHYYYFIVMRSKGWQTNWIVFPFNLIRTIVRFVFFLFHSPHLSIYRYHCKLWKSHSELHHYKLNQWKKNIDWKKVSNMI